MAELENTNEMMIQLPWAVPQQPLVTTQIQIDPETKKIPLDLNVSSTDTTAIWITGLSFIVTAFIVYMSTRQQIQANNDLIQNQSDRLDRELQWKRNQEWNNLFMDYSSDYLVTMTELIYETEIFQKEYLKMDELEKTITSIPAISSLATIKMLHSKVILSFHKLAQILDEDKNLSHKELILLGDTFNELFFEQREELLKANLPKVLGNHQQALKKLLGLLNKYLETIEVEEYKEKTILQVTSKIKRKISKQMKVIINQRKAA